MNTDRPGRRNRHRDGSGPAGLRRPPVSSSLIDGYRFAIEQFAAITASSVTAPSLAGTMNFAAMMFWALLASGQISMRKVDGWQTIATKPTDQLIDLAACNDTFVLPGERAKPNSNRIPDGTTAAA